MRRSLVLVLRKIRRTTQENKIHSKDLNTREKKKGRKRDLGGEVWGIDWLLWAGCCRCGYVPKLNRDLSNEITHAVKNLEKKEAGYARN